LWDSRVVTGAHQSNPSGLGDNAPSSEKLSSICLMDS
jgi:hypothetical protein